MLPNTNLQLLKPSRHVPRDGDRFALRVADSYLFGRVIHEKSSMPNPPTPGSILVYIYDTQSPDKNFLPSACTPDRLLIPPVFVHRALWNRGYFEHLSNSPLDSVEVRIHHYFWEGLRQRFIDEYGNQLEQPLESCGDFGLSSVGSLDHKISQALGIVPRDREE